MTFNRCVFHIKLVQLSGRASGDVELDFDQFAEEQQFVNIELQGKIDELRDTVARLESVDESVKAFISGVPQLIEEAVLKVKAEGVSDDQLTALAELQAHIQASVDDLTSAITTPGGGGAETPVTTEDATGFSGNEGGTFSDATFNGGSEGTSV
jgi:hypothetical protein